MRLVYGAVSVALGVVLIGFEHRDAKRAELGDATLDGARLSDVARRHVRCLAPRWHCELTARDDLRVTIPFECGGERVEAAFYADPPGCDRLPATIAGYLLDDNEACGSRPRWLLQVGAERTSFPGFLSGLGVFFVLLGIVAGVGRWLPFKS